MSVWDTVTVACFSSSLLNEMLMIVVDVLKSWVLYNVFSMMSPLISRSIFVNLPTPSQNMSVGKGDRLLCCLSGSTFGCVWWSDSAKCRVTDRTQAYFCTVIVSVILTALLRTYHSCTERTALFCFVLHVTACWDTTSKKLCHTPDHRLTHI